MWKVPFSLTAIPRSETSWRIKHLGNQTKLSSKEDSERCAGTKASSTISGVPRLFPFPAAVQYFWLHPTKREEQRVTLKRVCVDFPTCLIHTPGGEFPRCTEKRFLLVSTPTRSKCDLTTPGYSDIQTNEVETRSSAH